MGLSNPLILVQNPAMTDYYDLLKADNNQPAHMIQIIDAESFENWLSAQPQRVRTIVAAQKFAGKG